MAQEQQIGAFHVPAEEIPAAEAANLDLVGHACIRPVIANAFETHTLTDGLFAREAGDYLPEVTRKSYLAHLTILCAGDVMTFPHITTTEHLIATDSLVIANALAGFLTHLEPVPAVDRARKALLLFLKHWIGPGKTTFVKLTDTEYADLKGANGSWRNIAFLPENRGDLRNLDVGGIIHNPAYTLAVYRQILTDLVRLEAPRTTQAAPRVFATFFISMAKRGTITPDKLNKITEELAETLGISMELEASSIRLAFKTVGGKVPDNKIQPVFEHLSALVADISLRMKITLDQAVGTGLTALSTIKRAREKFPNFPWGRAARLLNTDFQRAAAAAREVQGDAYYGFRKTLGPVRSTLYRSLAWLCKELLVKYGGPEHGPLARYQGWNNNPEHKHVLIQMIDEFRPDVVGEGEEDAAGAADLAEALRGATGLTA
ncbi:putative nucleoprotein [Tacheng Tick Virus 5]|uniref:putative nucleoprotein n=1 Tax=Tacheng Tick Virus 5 TaxID=1608087 RepID=UPI0005AD4169|nr:putative nucleoprotein [Tacheng Tick Virus 5]AJG39059.1 putative nucleoprotein [Tacheng Tick Virus 5]